MASMFDLQRPTARRLNDPSKEIQRPTTSPAAAQPVSRTLSSASITSVPVEQQSASPSVTRPSGNWTPTRNSGIGQHGEPVYDASSISRTLAQRPGVTTQSFGTTPAQPAAAKSLVDANGVAIGADGTSAQRRTLSVTRPQPNVASTFGQSVRTLPDDSAMTIQRPQSSFRDPGAVAEHNNNREDRDARQKLASDLDSQRFRLEMIAQNPNRRGRAALDGLSQNSQQQAALAGGGERLSAEAIQGREARDNQMGIAQVDQAGQDRRAQFGAEVSANNAAADRAQQLGIATMNDATDRAKIGAGDHDTITAADGRVFRIGADGNAAAVKDTEGNHVRMPVARDAGALSVKDQLESVGSELKAATEQLAGMQSINGTATPEQLTAQQTYVSKLQSDLAGLRDGGAAGGAGNNGNRAKPTIEQFMARAKAQGSRMTPEQLKAHYDSMQ